MKQMTLKQERKVRKEIHELSRILVDVQRRLHDVGLTRTAAAINLSTNRIGFEFADMIEAKTK